ncbi:MAG: ribonuclease D, partial [Gemmataceae bacterium]
MPRRRTETFQLPESFVADARTYEDCLTHLQTSDTIAFDTEFVGEDTYRPDLCLVQVATRDRLFVLDPFALASLDDFWNLVSSGTKTVIVHAGREEVRMCWHGIGRPPQNLFDVQIAAGLVGFNYPIGYGTLVSD